MIGGIVYKYKKRQRKVSDVNTEKGTSPEDAFFVTPDEKHLIPPCQTTIDIFIPDKRNNALPKIEESGVQETESIPEKKSKKKKKKKKKKSKRREETDVPDDNLSNKDNF
ncbi:uncharacterized protein LOC134281909 [Saccostrea cucullata]|uniref:uncharacterized protein LOC134281909 n=1 Tax=Saccostrea cuccullata TaxID=36930 RepID=UPI002ED0DE7A